MALGRKVIVHPDIAGKLKPSYGDKINAPASRWRGAGASPSPHELTSHLKGEIYILRPFRDLPVKFEPETRRNADRIVQGRLYARGEAHRRHLTNLRTFPELLWVVPKLIHPEYW